MKRREAKILKLKSNYDSSKNRDPKRYILEAFQKELEFIENLFPKDIKGEHKGSKNI